jgi:capsular exopolysaccharide synthesis family protein
MRLGVKAEHQAIESKFLRTLRILPDNRGNLQVEVYSYNPTWPARWPETMVDEFMNLRREKRVKNLEAIMKSDGEELSNIKQKIDNDRASRSSYEDRAKFTQASVEASRFRELPNQLALVNQRIDQLKSIRQRLDQPGMDTVSRLSLFANADAEFPAPIGLAANEPGADAAALSGTSSVEDPIVADSVIVPGLVVEVTEWRRLEKRQRELLTELNDLRRIYLPGNQKMLLVRKELDQVQRTLDLDCDLARDRFNVIVRNLQEHYTEIQKQLPQYEKARRDYAEILAEGELQQSSELSWNHLYSEAAQTMSQAEFTADKEKINLAYDHMVELRDTVPVAPSKLKLALMSLAMGLAMAVAIPFLIEYLDYTLSNIEEVEATFQMRGLGIIPQIPHESDRPVLLDVSSSGDERNLVENFRVVRTNLLAIGSISKPAHVTMVTSAMPKEGKTVVSANLAISFGQTGARTLMVDTDLRRGRLHRLFGLRKSPGLSDFLLDKVSLDEAIRSTGKENVFILSAGQHIESGTELMGSAKFTSLMQRLRSEYERIIIDTPPVLGLSETSVLQNQVDGVLFVIWSGHTPIRNMKTAIDMLSANGANFYGFILNRLDLTTTTNYYQYYYYSSDYYHNYHALENA